MTVMIPATDPTRIREGDISKSILVCADLDRTVLPNGEQPESAGARERFRALARRDEIILVYVSGRDRRLIAEAIEEYGIPVPRFAVGDVGTTIHRIDEDTWQPLRAWDETIAADWRGLPRTELEAMIGRRDGLWLQEPERQGRFKLSYYAPLDIDHGRLTAAIDETLRGNDVRAALIWSVDEEREVGLIDVLPASATKIDAVRFLMRSTGVDDTRTVFAGDSGNDLPALTSGLKAVLVRNAAAEVRDEASRTVSERGVGDRLYVARGGFLGMNGNYVAGVLEGLAHFLPETESWMG